MLNQSIQVKGLRKSYQKVQVLSGVDFEVTKGSIFALLGSNGAGKTTIVKILTTLLKADGGVIPLPNSFSTNTLANELPSLVISSLGSEARGINLRFKS